MRDVEHGTERAERNACSLADLAPLSRERQTPASAYLLEHLSRFLPILHRVALSFHDMRHAFASRMIARGIEPVTLAKLMGHEDIRETLNTYADQWDRVRTDDVVREAMAF